MEHGLRGAVGALFPLATPLVFIIYNDRACDKVHVTLRPIGSYKRHSERAFSVVKTNEQKQSVQRQ